MKGTIHGSALPCACLTVSISSQAEDSSRAKWQDERARLVKEHQNQLEHMRSEYDSKLADQRAQIERDLGMRMNSELEKARNGWEKEQQDARCDINKLFRDWSCYTNHLWCLLSLTSVDMYPFLTGFNWKINMNRKRDKPWIMPDFIGKNNSDKKSAKAAMML